MTGRSEYSEDPNGCKDLEVVLMNTQQERKFSFMFTPNKNIQAEEKKRGCGQPYYMRSGCEIIYSI